MPTAEEYIQKIKSMEQDRSDWDSDNKNITYYQMPHRGSYRGEDTSANRYRHIINEAVPLAARVTVAGMIWGLSSPAANWFAIQAADKELADYRPVKEWLTTVRKRIQWVLNQGNFYSALYQIYEEECGFGTAAQAVIEDPDTFAFFMNMTAGEYAVDVNHLGRPNTLSRRYKQTARQVAGQFGEDNLPEGMKRTFRQSPNQTFDIGHIIEPNPDRKPGQIDNRNLPWRSAMVNISENTLLRESGFFEQPFMAPRWYQVGQERYGRGIGSLMLGSAMQLQEMEKESLRAIYKMVRPPLQGPAGYIDDVDLTGSRINPVPPTGTAKLESIYNVRLDIKSVEEKIRQSEQRISHAYFNDLFLFLMNNPNATATEILEKKSEKVILLGPVVTRQQSDYFDLMIQRVYGMLLRTGALPPAPEELQGQTIEVEYISQLAIAARMAQSEGIQEYMAFVGNAAQMKPEAVDKFDADEAIDEIAEMYGVPPRINRSRDAVEKIRKARLEAQRKAREEEQLREGVQTAKDLSEIDTSKRSALKDLAQGAERTT